MPDLEHEAHQAREDISRAAARLRSAELARDEVVSSMLAEGWSLSRIGAAFGVSRSRAQQLVRRVREQSPLSGELVPVVDPTVGAGAGVGGPVAVDGVEAPAAPAPDRDLL